MKATLIGCVLGLAIIMGVRLSEAAGSHPCEVYKGGAFLALLDERFPLKDAARFLKGLRCPAVGVLYKTFGKSLSRIVRLQTMIGKPLKVHLYADCGPCRYPRRPRGFAPLFKPELSIDDFNAKIVASGRLRASFRREMLRPLFRLGREHRSLIVEVSPALEDNYSMEARGVIWKLLRAERRFARAPMVSLKMNPLFYYPYSSFPIEAHTCSERTTSLLRKGDTLSFDGVHIAFRGEGGDCQSGEAKKLVGIASRKKADVLLWRAPWQGLSNEERVGKPISQRVFVLDKLKECLTILKG